MSTETVRQQDPQWTLADRLRKSRETAGLERHELADRLGISRNTVINYETGKTHPPKARLALWALATGVREEWLRGVEPGTTGRLHRDPVSIHRPRFQLLDGGRASADGPGTTRVLRLASSE